MTTYPLLQSQVGIYHAWRANPSSVAYNLPAVVPFPRSIDLDRLHQALQHIWEHRPELHTRITLSSDGEAHQWTDPHMTLSIAHHTLTEKDAQSYIDRGFVRPFDVLGGEPLVRFETIETAAHHYLLCDFHHLICDGMTLSHVFLANDLPDAYAGNPLTPSAYGLYQHAEAEQTTLHSEQYERDAQFYRERFGDVAFTTLSTATSQPWGERIYANSQLPKVKESANAPKIVEQASYLFLAAFTLVLSRLGGNGQVAYVTLHHGRTDRRLHNAYGMFVQSVPVLAQVSEQMSVHDLLTQLRQWLINTVRHQTYPLTHLCRDLHKTPSITFAFQGDNIVEQTTTGGLTTIGYQPVQGTTQNDLSCMVYDTGDHYEIRTEASSARWSQQRLHTLAKAVCTCAANLMEHPDGTLADIDIITPEEHDELLHLGQGEHLDYDPTQTIVTLFLQQAQRTPDALAVTDGTTSLTYQELDLRSEAFAQQLLQQGIQPGTFVPITCERSTHFLVEALGIMRMGAAYVPIDAEWPESRQQQIMEECKMLNGKCASTEKSSTLNISHSTSLIAYLIYTSGSTGEPKVVMISHRALLNLVHSIVHLFGLTAHSRISCHSSFAFDASVEDLFPVLTVGGSVHIMPEDIRRDPAQIHQFLLSHRITGGCYTTHLGLHLAKHFDLPMDYLCLGGERLTTYPHTHPQVFNTYGPTEFTVDATCYKIPSIPSPQPSPCKYEGAHTVCSQTTDTPNGVLPLTGGVREGIPPIGRPLPNLTAYVTDPNGHLLPRGEVGELCLSGIQKATNCTEEPYHTGDLVRWNEEGQLEYIGRKDRLLKLRGYRISPEEIEQRLEQTDGIQQAIVVANPTGTQLLAYFTASSPISEEELSQRLSQSLPPYMVPTRFFQLDKMPLTTAGKPDHTTLPMPDAASSTYTPPANDEERLWCTLFEQVLDVHPVSATSHFFHLGGTSILGASLQAEALRHGIQLSYGDVFTSPTPQLLAQRFQSPKTDLVDIGQPTSSTSVDRRRRHRSRGSESAPITPVLLTGSTGFLGRYILHELLTTTTDPIYCLVRAEDEQHAMKRLRDALSMSTFAPSQEELERVHPIVGDLLTLTPSQLPPTVNTIIHCAADTRHFAPDHEIETTNIQGTDCIIQCCVATGTRLIHISTLGADLQSANPYVRSKAICETHIHAAIHAHGLHATIVRIGNLTTPDGLPQGTLAAAIHALCTLGQYPQSIAHLPIHLSPADQTAQAILLQQTPATQPVPLSHLLQQQKDAPLPVSDQQFQTTLAQALANPLLRPTLVPLLHYLSMADPENSSIKQIKQ